MRRGKCALLGLLLGACGGQARDAGGGLAGWSAEVGQAAGSAGVELAAGSAGVELAAGNAGEGHGAGSAGVMLSAGVGGVAQTSSAGTGSIGVAHAARNCDNPLPRAHGGGYSLCADGSLRRSRAGPCQVLLPRPEADQPMIFSECRADSDCTSSLYGFCAGGACKYGCRVDDDCGNGEACFCGELIGSCISASCRSDADCPPEFPCTGYQAVGFATPDALACQSPMDACLTDAQCNSLNPRVSCQVQVDHRVCYTDMTG